MKRKTIPFLITLFLSIICAGKLHAQLIVTEASDLDGWTADSLVRNILLDNGVTISNAKFNGSDGIINCNSIGKFETGATPTNIGMESGLVLASGGVTIAIGPNDTDEGNVATTCGAYYDNDLASIASGPTNDVAVLEFDFIPWDNVLTFNFVFGSEEYMEYVGSEYNDVFGFFVDGINPAGGYYNHENIALVPGTTEVVSINNVNSGHNSRYYIDNTGGTTIQFDGFTTLIEVSINVVPMSNYHIKMAICDVGDDFLDSGVFLEAHSFSTNFNYTMTIDGWDYSEIPEGYYFCTNQAIEFNTETNWHYDDVTWYFGDGTSARGEQATHTYSADGFYTVTNVLHNPHRDMDSLYLSKEIEVRTLTAEEYVTSCDSYEWYGTNYTESGIYTHIVHTPEICDSTYVLHLEIGESFSSEEDVTACNNYSWRGTNYTESGTYTDFVQAPGACDSTFVLNLTLGHDFYGDTTAVACNAFSWHGAIYTESGDYPYELQTPQGCDSIVTLHLTIGQELIHPTEEEVICGNSFTWHGHDYLHNGVYYDTIADAAGCNEIYVLDLTLVERYNTSLNETVCDRYPWPSATGGYLTESGHYLYEGLTQDGCDSIVDLNLTVNHTPNPVVECITPGVESPHYLITATEFNVNRYTYRAFDPLSDFTWTDSLCEWSISKPSWRIIPSNDNRTCTVYPMDWVEDTVWLSFKAVNPCSREDDKARFWLKPSFYGVDEDEAASCTFDIIPNPNNGAMELRFEHMEGKVEVKVYDMMGILVDSFETYNNKEPKSIQYNLSGLGGIYFFVVNGKEGTMTKKVIVK